MISMSFATLYTNIISLNKYFSSARRQKAMIEFSTDTFNLLWILQNIFSFTLVLMLIDNIFREIFLSFFDFVSTGNYRYLRSISWIGSHRPQKGPPSVQWWLAETKTERAERENGRKNKTSLYRNENSLCGLDESPSLSLLWCVCSFQAMGNLIVHFKCALGVSLETKRRLIASYVVSTISCAALCCYVIDRDSILWVRDLKREVPRCWTLSPSGSLAFCLIDCSPVFIVASVISYRSSQAPVQNYLLSLFRINHHYFFAGTEQIYSQHS